jgi:hypothetical protein
MKDVHLKDTNLKDTWKQLHPQDRDYSFYSCPQETHRVVETEYLSRTISQIILPSHFLFGCRMEFKGRRLNPTLLKEAEFYPNKNVL